MRKDKNRKRFLWISVIIFLLLMLVFCICIINKNSESIIVKDNVITITKDLEKELQPVFVNDKELVFNVDPQYSKGDVVVAGIIDSAPTGFIRKVVDIIEKENQYIVKTEYAVLTDVFEKAHVVKRFVLSEEGVKEDIVESSKTGLNAQIEMSICNNELVQISDSNYDTYQLKQMSFSDRDIEYNFSKDFTYDLMSGIKVNGEVVLNAWLEIELNIRNGEVEFECVFYDELGGEIFVGCSADAKAEFVKELFAKRLPNIQFMIGIVPVVITNEMQAILEADFSLQGDIGTSFEIDSKNASGFRYDSKNNILQEVREKEYLSDGIEWNTIASVTGTQTAGVFLHLVTKLYDSTGFDISVGIEDEISAEVNASPNEKYNGLNYLGSIDMSVYPKLQGDVLVSIPIIDKQLIGAALFDVKLDPFWEYHWDSGKGKKPELEKQEDEHVNINEDLQEEIRIEGSAEESISGNTVSNIAWGGRFAKQGEWIYYYSWLGPEEEGVYKIKTDGTGKELVYGGMVNCINVVGEDVYCYDIFDKSIKKISSTGKIETISSCEGAFIVIGEYIYMQNGSNLYRMQTDGKDRIRIANHGTYNTLNVVDDTFYFVASSRDEAGIYKKKVFDEDDCEKVCDYQVIDTTRPAFILVDNGRIYFAEENGIYSVKIDGTERETVVEISSENNMLVGLGDEFLIDDEYIYFVVDMVEWYRVKKDGSRKEKVDALKNVFVWAESNGANYMAIFDGLIYLCNGGQIKVLSVDGEEILKIK